MNSPFCCQPSIAEVRERAYLHYVASGCQPGRELENWLLAEREVRERLDPSIPESEDVPSLLHFPPNADALRVDTPHPFPLHT